ncbi:L-lactate dehydrogenase [Youxingia wuxianensis]|uniref:L-lactate dehydrogenase n=1 Tax=Youxingia wuxianensis TaxID=2763678 RepID=A0A926ETP2_9FIRM|nr:L-lactate dehydrogenase [Youxingia wuxianensis]MBC8586417.1 L-lactate dehydrogenase [Youxingia wuxianensis]
MNANKVVLIGAGMVGAATLNSILMLNLVSELVVIDQNVQRAQGEVMDASHTTAFAYSSGANIRVGTYADCKDARIIVMTAGPSIKPGEKMDRQILAQQNAGIMTQVMSEITKYTQDAIIITVTNPVDVVTYLAKTRANYPGNKIFGTGTLLDTARMRQIIAQQVGVDSKNVHGYVLGEHGNSAFIPWNLVDIAGVPVDQLDRAFHMKAPIDKEKVFEGTKSAGFDIIQLKGYTSSGIAMSVCRLIKAIILDERSILPISVVLDGHYDTKNVALSVPCVVGKNGAEHILEVPLTSEERRQFKQCAQNLTDILGKIS